jgi:aspartyl-tRNA(Asn)/glutamyl-tRNA(Gln) amidotransferase subunit B
MEYEYERQVDLIESGGKVVQETLRFDDATGTTSSMRSKEDAHDYRYFRDPDLVTIHISREEVEELRAQLPELPADRFRRYIDELGLPEKDAALLRTYFTSDCSLKHTCETLYLHKNTLQYRLDRVARETGYNPRVFNDAIRLYLALKLDALSGK